MEEDKFSIKKVGNDIVLAGEIKANDSSTLDSFLNGLAPGSYKVIADNANLRPVSVEVWVNAVEKNLTAEHHLRYTASHLGIVLFYDDRYEHETHTFDDQHDVR